MTQANGQFANQADGKLLAIEKDLCGVSSPKSQNISPERSGQNDQTETPAIRHDKDSATTDKTTHAKDLCTCTHASIHTLQRNGPLRSQELPRKSLLPSSNHAPEMLDGRGEG
jgi:hypothetical protein